MLSPSTAIEGWAAGSTTPFSISAMYISSRFTPWLGTPRMSAATSTSATASALAAVAPTVTKQARTTALSSASRIVMVAPPRTTAMEPPCMNKIHMKKCYYAGRRGLRGRIPDKRGV